MSSYYKMFYWYLLKKSYKINKSIFISEMAAFLPMLIKDWLSWQTKTAGLAEVERCVFTGARFAHEHRGQL